MQDWAAVGSPITGVRLMGGLANRRRSLTARGRPLVSGYVLVGDASLYTNATFGQGIGLGFWQAEALANLGDLIGRENLALLQGLEQWTDDTLGPRYTAQVQVDEGMIDSLAVGITGVPATRPPAPAMALGALAYLGDADAGRAFYRLDNMLSTLDAELSDPALKGRLDAFLAEAAARPPKPGPLSIVRFEEILR